jgi:hypothetical protein
MEPWRPSSGPPPPISRARPSAGSSRPRPSSDSVPTWSTSSTAPAPWPPHRDGSEPPTGTSSTPSCRSSGERSTPTWQVSTSPSSSATIRPTSAPRCPNTSVGSPPLLRSSTARVRSSTPTSAGAPCSDSLRPSPPAGTCSHCCNRRAAKPCSRRSPICDAPVRPAAPSRSVPVPITATSGHVCPSPGSEAAATTPPSLPRTSRASTSRTASC